MDRLLEIKRDMVAISAIPGMSVACAELRPGSLQVYPLAGDAGIVLGKLFHRDVIDGHSPREISFDQQDSERITATRGQWLLEHYWGRYIALLVDRDTTVVLRDPTGGIPCYFTSVGHMHVFFSHAEDCLALNLRSFTINWRYVQASLVRLHVQAATTGVKEIENVRQGERILLVSDKAPRRELAWKPVQIAEAIPLEDPDLAIAITRCALQGCIGAWASCYSDIVLRYSGGLDCTIVLACLHQARPRPNVICLSYADFADDSHHERAYARRAAETAAGGRAQEFIDLERNTATVDVQCLRHVARFPTRPLYLIALADAPYDFALGRARGAALFDGFLGDQLFYTDTNTLAADYAWHHGVGPRMFQIARHTAKSQSLSLMNILKRALYEGLVSPQSTSQHLPDFSPFVTGSALEDFMPHAEHYLSCHWLSDSAARIAPGKRTHVEWLCWPSANVNPFRATGDPEEIVPLASQPLYEVFLRIPSFVLCHGGLDRILVRRAFAHALPPELVSPRNTTAFGETPNRQVPILRRNREFFRELLMDGVLAQKKYLDRPSVEAFFHKLDSEERQWDATDLSPHVDLELWLRSWQASP